VIDPVTGRLDDKARTLEWDSSTLRFRNAPEVDRLITKAYRAGLDVPAAPVG